MSFEAVPHSIQKMIPAKKKVTAGLVGASAAQMLDFIERRNAILMNCASDREKSSGVVVENCRLMKIMLLYRSVIRKQQRGF